MLHVRKFAETNEEPELFSTFQQLDVDVLQHVFIPVYLSFFGSNCTRVGQVFFLTLNNDKELRIGYGYSVGFFLQATPFVTAFPPYCVFSLIEQRSASSFCSFLVPLHANMGTSIHVPPKLTSDKNKIHTDVPRVQRI